MHSCTDFVPWRYHFPVSQRKEAMFKIYFIDYFLYNNSEDMSSACVMQEENEGGGSFSSIMLYFSHLVLLVLCS